MTIDDVLIGREKIVRPKGSKYVNEHFFDEESKIMWYIVGAFYPCYIPPSKSEDKIIFRSSNKHLVEIIADKLDTNYAIVSDPRENKSSHFITIRSNHMRSQLKELNLVSEKSKREFPRNIKNVYLDHFIRGFFDAQAYISLPSINHKLTNISILFYRFFILNLHYSLVEHAGVERKEPQGNIVRYGHSDSIKIYNFIYRDWDFIKKQSIYVPSKKKLFNTNYKIYYPYTKNPKFITANMKKIAKARELLNEGEKVYEVSKILGYNSLSGFYYFFKKEVKKTPFQYGDEQRFIKAKELLLKGKSITEVMRILNYSRRRFDDLFKRHAGETTIKFVIDNL